MELRSYLSAHHKQLLVGASVAIAVSGLVLTGARLSDDTESAGASPRRSQRVGATTFPVGEVTWTPNANAANAQFRRAFTMTGWTFGSGPDMSDTITTGSEGVDAGDGDDGVESDSTVDTPAAPRKVTITATPPSYTPGSRGPSLAPPAVSGGSPPNVEHDDSSVSVYFGSAPTVTPPAVDTGERGTINQPDADVSIE